MTLETPRGTLVFNDYAAASYLRLTSFKIQAGVRSAVEAVPRRDGSIVPGAYRNGATPVLNGDIKAATPTDRANLSDEVRAHLVSILRADGILRWTPTGKPTRRMVVRCLEDPGEDGAFVKSFQLALVSRTAYALSDTENVATLRALDAPLGGAAWGFPYSFPMTFGGGTPPGSAFVTNAGNTDAWPVLRVTGPFLNPVLRNATLNASLALTYNIPTGSFLLVDMAAESVLLNGDPAQPKIGSMNPLNANFWPLAEGLNEIRVTSDTHGTGHGVSVYWRDASA